MHYVTTILKDVTLETIRNWVSNVETAHYILRSFAREVKYDVKG